MPAVRQYKVVGLFVFLVILMVYYGVNGAKETRNSPFYQNTLAQIKRQTEEASRQSVIDDERHRQDRVDRLRKEHDIAVSTSGPLLASEETPPAGVAGGVAGAANQKPILGNAAGQGEAGATDAEKSVAGRKKMKDDRLNEVKTATDDYDGVAKVGNVGTKETDTVKKDKTKPESEGKESVETVLSTILKRAPVIIFSKTYCPFSKKAKHILQELYTITPEPYVVELDEHELGPQLQDALQVATGRRTVPNILVNGKSIGGGDDVYDLHSSGKLINKIESLGGKRITSVVAVPESGTKKEVKFKA